MACWLCMIHAYYVITESDLIMHVNLVKNHETSQKVPQKVQILQKMDKKLYWPHFGHLYDLPITKYGLLGSFFIIYTIMPKPRPVAHFGD